MSKRVFITGGTGLLGKEIIDQLAKEQYEIIALKRDSSITKGFPEKIQWVEGDLLQPEDFIHHLANVDLLIHTAAKVSFNPSRGQQIIDFNVESTKALVNASLEHNCEFVYVSSVAALGSVTNRPINETDDFNVNELTTPYGYSKHFSEMEVWRGVAEGLKAFIVNPSIIVGIPAKWHESTGTFWKQISGGFSYFPKGSTGFVDARDVAKSILSLYNNKKFGERFIINGENASYEKFFKLIHQELGRNSRMKPIPKWISAAAWRVCKGLRFFGLKAPYSKAIHQTMNNQIEYSNQKIQEIIHFDYTSLAESVAWATKDFRIANDR